MVDSPKVGYLLSDDLIFASRITGTAQVLGFQVIAVRTATQLLQLAAQHAPRCLIVDLSNPGLEVTSFVQSCRALTPPPFIAAYGSHVDTATLRGARDAGCDLVWPRSKFVEELAQAMPGWFERG